MNITDLNKLTQTNVADIDPLFVQDVSESETKLLLSSDLGNYIISSSNLHISLKSGSFTGSFYGNLNGKSTNASSSFLSKYSKNSTYLNYPNYSTASYSLFSISSSKTDKCLENISSSYSVSSSNSISASHANTWIIKSAVTSSLSKLSLISLYSTSSNYLIYNGTDNGKVYKSVISEYSPTASIGIELIGNTVINDDTNPNATIIVNDSKASEVYTSSLSSRSNSARYIDNVSFSERSSFALNTDLIPFAYINFKISHTNGKDWTFKVNQYKNIKDPGVGIASLPDLNDSVAIFTGSYDVPPTSPTNPSLSPSATILAETSFNFPFDNFVNYWFTTFSYPIGSDKFAICIRVGIVPSLDVGEDSIDNVLFSLLNNATISAVMYSNVTGQQTPLTINTSTELNAALLEGCARI